MGWSFYRNADKRSVISTVIRDQETDTHTWHTLAHTVRGNVLWSLTEITTKENGTAERFIACHLLAREKGYGWGYKAMEESMHPYYYSCPLTYLDMAPEANAEWRTHVREYHKRKAEQRTRVATAQVGQCRALIGATIPHVCLVYKRKRTWVGTYKGVRYRIPSKMLGPVIPG